MLWFEANVLTVHVHDVRSHFCFMFASSCEHPISSLTSYLGIADNKQVISERLQRLEKAEKYTRRKSSIKFDSLETIST